jgi:hypothetical protein
VLRRLSEEPMTDDRDFPPIDPEQARTLLSVVYQAIQTAIDVMTCRRSTPEARI